MACCSDLLGDRAKTVRDALGILVERISG